MYSYILLRNIYAKRIWASLCVWQTYYRPHTDYQKGCWTVIIFLSACDNIVCTSTFWGTSTAVGSRFAGTSVKRVSGCLQYLFLTGHYTRLLIFLIKRTKASLHTCHPSWPFTMLASNKLNSQNQQRSDAASITECNKQYSPICSIPSDDSRSPTSSIVTGQCHWSVTKPQWRHWWLYCKGKNAE